jgi:arginase family enzyme
VVDPLERWRALGLPNKPDYAGLLTYAGMPYTQDPAELRGVDVAIVGAPCDDLVSDRPGARFAPRAIRAASCPPGPHSRRRWTRSPSSGSSTSARRVAESLELVGAEVVEVIPTAVASADVTALVADRVVREILTGIAVRRARKS